MSDRSNIIPQDVIDDVASKVDIAEVIGRYVSLSKKGNNYFGLCPFHNERTPSFSVSATKQFYHCFGCGAGGNVFSFIMQIEQLTFPEAVRKLAQEVGVHIPERALSQAEMVQKKRRARLISINEMAAQFYMHALKSKHGAPFRQYLKERQLSDDMIDRFSLGATIGGWSNLSNWLLKKGVSKEELCMLGLSMPRQNGTLYDRFRDRLIFPIKNEKGETIAFGGRIIELDKAPQKYLNSAETPLFHKSDTLYGLNLAKKAIREHDQVIIVEGYMDVISCHQHGLDQVVAPLGTALTEQQIKKLMRHTYHFVTSFDADTAGKNATLKSIDRIEALGGHARVLDLPHGDDPDDFIKKYGVAEMNVHVADATEGLLFYVRTLLEDRDISRIEDRMNVLDQIIPLIRYHKSPAALDHDFKLVSDALGMSAQSVQSEWRQYMRRQSRHQRTEHDRTEEIKPMPRDVEAPYSDRTASILAFLIEKPSRIEKIEQAGGVNLFDESAKSLYLSMKECYLDGDVPSIAQVPQTHISEVTSMMHTMEDMASTENADERFLLLLLEVQYAYVSEQYQQTVQSLNQLQHTSASSDEVQLLNRLEQLLALKTTLERQLGRET